MTSLEPRFIVPAWPIELPDLYMGYVGRVLVCILGKHLSNAQFELHVRELEKAIDLRTAGEKVGVLYHSEASTAYTRNNVKLLGDMLKPREKILGETTAAYAMCTSSVINRTALRIVFRFAPPPYPQSIVKSVEHAYDYLARNLQDLPKQAYLDWHARKVASMNM